MIGMFLVFTTFGSISFVAKGAAPGFPPGLEGPARVVADVLLLPDGSVAEASVRSGESPWAEGLLLALRTWRFASAPEGVEVSFTVEADFVSPARAGQPPRVDLKLTNPGRRDVGAAPAPEAAADAANAAPADDPRPAGPAPAESPAPQATPSEAPSPEPDVQTPEPGLPAPAGIPASPAPAPAEPPSPSPAPGPAAPPVEVISGPAIAPPPPPPPQPGFSAVRDVSLGLGVPDLVKGRRPVVPPLARMAGEGGEVTVTFSVDAGGTSSVQKVEGTELLKEAARQAVASWTFRRTTAERIFLSAAFTFQGDQARADVRRAE